MRTKATTSINAVHVRLHRDSTLTGPDDPGAEFCHNLIDLHHSIVAK